jgi:hypothetical protein
LYLKAPPCEEDLFPQLKKDPSADHMKTFSHFNIKIISALCWGKTGFHRPTPPIFRSTPLGYLRKACSHRPPLILGPTHSGYHPQGYDPQIGEAPGPSRPSPTQKIRYPKKFNLHPKIAIWWYRCKLMQWAMRACSWFWVGFQITRAQGSGYLMLEVVPWTRLFCEAFPRTEPGTGLHWIAQLVSSCNGNPIVTSVISLIRVWFFNQLKNIL